MPRPAWENINLRVFVVKNVTAFFIENLYTTVRNQNALPGLTPDFLSMTKRDGVCNPVPNVSELCKTHLTNIKRFGRGNMPRPAW